MAEATERNYKRAGILIPLLYIGGVIATILGVAFLVSGNFRVAGLPLLFGGLGAIAFALLLELLTEIAGHLAAIRTQMNRGVLGLLG